MNPASVGIIRALVARSRLPRRYIRIDRRGRLRIKSPQKDPHRWAVVAAEALEEQQAREAKAR